MLRSAGRGCVQAAPVQTRLRRPGRSLQHAVARQMRARSGEVGEVSLGGVACRVWQPERPQLVPVDGYLPDDASILQQVRWMMQKHNLGQDIFLMGPPGPRRRWLALKFCHALMKEVEYLSLSRDTTESDIKQRREIQDGGVVFVDQPAVQAAIHGRVLILDGVERVERNVLPIINNLLENREMSLEDGRFLTSPDRYDELLLTHTREQLDSMGLVQVSRDFRVIALGLPVPRYAGTPLDPPLRSRFQCLGVGMSSLGMMLAKARAQAPGLSDTDTETMVGFLAGLQAAEQGGTDQDQEQHFPDMLEEDLLMWAATAEAFPADSLCASLRRVYPYHVMAEFKNDDDHSRRFMADVLARYSLRDAAFAKGVHAVDTSPAYELSSLSLGASHDVRYAEALFRTRDGATVTHTCGCGEAPQELWQAPAALKQTASFRTTLADMLKDHSLGRHLCLVGEAGSGKSALVKMFAGMLGYNLKMSTLHCHWDMSSRDMLQRRVTNEDGNTTWQAAALTEAALHGRLVVLDGVDRLQPGVLASLGRLCVDGEITLYDGTVLRRSADYQKLLQSGLTREDLTERKVFEVHPAFKIIALAHPPSASSGEAGGHGANWVAGEVQHFFAFHRFLTPPADELREILTVEATRGGGDASLCSENVRRLLELHVGLAEASREDSAVPVMSLRQLSRIAKSVRDGQDGQLYDAVADSLLVDLMPQFAAERVGPIVRAAGIMQKVKSASQLSVLSNTAEDGTRSVTIGDATVAVRPLVTAEEHALVPNIVFHDNPEHLASLEKMMRDMNGDSHVLLIGRQGVGKNRLVDRLLQLLDRPRQYVQLHRDSTVSSLTVRPEVVDGKIVWEDAPLVKAVKQGHVLVVDEIDKAPLEVVGILKGLVEDKELLLSDGRRIVDAVCDKGGWTADDGAIELHPNFKLIALANVPGFPFLGNDFFAACGDLFRCHLIDNPERASRLEVLQQYGPNVPLFALNSMIDAFEELSQLVQEGLLAYPYSLRELVAVVKHVEVYPDDGMVCALRNVFDFDAFDAASREIVEGVFEKHGIPLTGEARAVHTLALADVVALPAPKALGRFSLDASDTEVRVSAAEDVEVREWAWPHTGSADASIIEGRQNGRFDERLYSVAPPGSVRDLAATLDGNLHVLLDVKGTGVPAIVTYRGKNLYAPVFSRPSSLDHGSSRLLGLERFVEESGAQAGSLRLHALGNKLVVWSADSLSLLIVDPKERTAARHIPPLLRAATDGSASWNLMSSLRGGSGSGVHLEESSLRYGRVLVWSEEGYANVLDTDAGAWVRVSFEGVAVGETWLDVRAVSESQVLVQTNNGLFLAGIGGEGGVRQVTAEEAATVAEDADWLAAVPRAAVHPGSFVPTSPTYACGDVTNDNVTVRELPALKRDVVLPGSPRHCAMDSAGHRIVYRAANNGFVVVDTVEASVRVIGADDITVRGATPRPQHDPVHSLALLPNNCVALTSPSLQQVLVVDLNAVRLREEWGKWASIIGGGAGGAGSSAAKDMEFQYSNSKIQPNELKHGKVDPDNTPHVGGNTWAGGTGGTDTAGLGGRVGPYRLDAGHPVHQVSDEAKAAVPEHLKEQAKAMGQEALKKRLQDIEMTQQESSMYNRAHDAVRKEVALMQTMLKGLRSKDGERVWLKNQTDGVWDETKLVEGLAGEKGIYKKRAEGKDSTSPIQGKKKRIVFCMDCSASMYRFNSTDGRLDRMVETAIMVTEAFKGTEDKIEYSMIGHSGDSAAIPLVDFGKAPTNKKERLSMVLSMVAHTQYCWSGDHTLESMQHAIRVASQTDSDQRFVFVISDANLRRYGIQTSTVARIVKSDPKVNVFCIFIASMGQEADRIKRDLPAGHGHVCYNTSDLPSVLKRIFLSTSLLK